MKTSGAVESVTDGAHTSADRDRDGDGDGRRGQTVRIKYALEM